MHKAIEKVEAYKTRTIVAALEKARLERAEALGSFNDTGYDRYYNKANRLEKEIAELEDYIDRDRAIDEAIAVKKKSQEQLAGIKKALQNKIFYLLKAIPKCSEGESLRAFVETL